MSVLGACASTLPARAGAESPLDRIRALVHQKRRLTWQNETMTRELAFASTPAPYIFVDLHARTLEFRVRGKAPAQLQWELGVRLASQRLQ